MCHLSFVYCYLSFVICHLSFVICHLSPTGGSGSSSHLSFVICLLSFVICHLSPTGGSGSSSGGSGGGNHLINRPDKKFIHFFLNTVLSMIREGLGISQSIAQSCSFTCHRHLTHLSLPFAICHHSPVIVICHHSPVIVNCHDLSLFACHRQLS